MNSQQQNNENRASLIEPEESQVRDAITSKFSSHVTYLKMNNNLENQNKIEAAAYRHSSDQLLIPSSLASSSQILFNQPNSNCNYGGSNPFKPPVYQTQRSSKMIFEPALTKLHSHEHNVVESSMNFLIMSHSSHSSNEETRCSLNAITSSSGGDAITSSSNSLRFNYPQSQKNSAITGAGSQVAQSFSSSIVNLFESKENSSIACNNMMTADDIMMNIDSQTKTFGPHHPSTQMTSFRLSAPTGCQQQLAQISLRNSVYSQGDETKSDTRLTSSIQSSFQGVVTANPFMNANSSSSNSLSQLIRTTSGSSQAAVGNSYAPPPLQRGQSCVSVNSQSRSSSVNPFMGDRFIPFRGNSDNFYMEEYILNNEDPMREVRNKKEGSAATLNGATSDLTAPSSQSVLMNQNGFSQVLPSDLVVSRVNQTPNGPSSSNPSGSNMNGGANNGQSTTNGNEAQMTADRVQNSGSSNTSSTQYSLGSGHKKKQSFQEFMTESMFTTKRGSPNTLTLQEAEDEQLRFSRITDGKKRTQQQENGADQRILSFKEKRSRPSMSLHKNISLIQTLAQEKTQKQQKTIRSIPQFPEKILDAPDIVDDYYLNLLDWSQNNILAVCLAQTVYLWNAVTGDIKQVFDTQNDSDIVTSVAWMPGASHVLAIGTSSKQMHLWDTNQFQRIRTFENQHDGRISSLAWNPSHSSILSSGSIDSQIHNNDIRISTSQSIVCTYQGHRQEVCGLKWSPDGQQLASGGNDNLLCIWDINSRMRGGMLGNNHMGSVVSQARYCFTDHKAAVKALAWCPWQRHLLASGGGSRDQAIKFWNTDSGQLVSSLQTESQVCALQWNPYDKEILSSHGFVNNQLCIWKYPQMKKIADLRGHTSRVLHLALNPDGTTVASAAADETLRFWKVFQASSTHATKKPIVPSRQAATIREASHFMASTIDEVDSECSQSANKDHGNADIMMTDSARFFQASPSQFNGYSLR